MRQRKGARRGVWYNKRVMPRKQKRGSQRESDGQYLLKLVLMLILGSVWLRWHQGLLVNGAMLPPLPIGMALGLVMVHQFEHYAMDRKIWFVVLIITAIISYFLPSGIMI